MIDIIKIINVFQFKLLSGPICPWLKTQTTNLHDSAVFLYKI